jgi:hypothetical protein
MGKACTTYRERVDVHIEFWWENLRKGGYLEGPGEDGKIILK